MLWLINYHDPWDFFVVRISHFDFSYRGICLGNCFDFPILVGSSKSEPEVVLSLGEA